MKNQSIYKALAVPLLAIAALLAQADMSHAAINVQTNLLGPNLANYANGLVGWWTFDGPNLVTNAADSSGLGINGYLTGFTSTSTSVVAGRLGQALHFNGTNNYVRATSTSQAQNITGPMTITAWIKSDAISSNFQAIVSKDNPNGESWWCGVKDGSTGYLQFEATNDGAVATQMIGTQAMQPNKWYFITCQYDGAKLKIYINGTLEGTPVDFTGPIFSNFRSSVVIGDSLLNANNFFAGSIDDVRIYSKALTPTEIRALYNSASAKVNSSSGHLTNGSTVKNGLVGLWTFDGKDINWGGNTATDTSSNNNTGTLVSLTQANAVVGKLGQALFLNGNNYVDLGSGSSLNITGPLTISAWIRPSNVGVGNQIILSRGSVGSSASVEQYFLAMNNNGSAQTITLGLSNGATVSAVESSTGVVSNSVWAHVVGTYDGTTMCVYVNGTVSGACAAASIPTLNSVGDSPKIGTNSFFPSQYFQGAVDDVRIYNRGLSASEVAALYKTGSVKIQASTAVLTNGSSLASGLIMHWTFDGSTVDWAAGLVTDSSGNGCNGNITGMSTSSSPIIGKIGQGLSFDGADDAIIGGTCPSMTANNAYTQSFWMKTNGPPAFYNIIGGSYYRKALMYAGASPHKAICINNGQAFDGAFSLSDVDDGKWHHIACVSTATTVAIYVDGAKEATVTSTLATNNNSTIQVGADGDGGNLYLGALDDVRVYNRALSDAEVSQLYRLGR